MIDFPDLEKTKPSVIWVASVSLASRLVSGGWSGGLATGQPDGPGPRPWPITACSFTVPEKTLIPKFLVYFESGSSREATP